MASSRSVLREEPARGGFQPVRSSRCMSLFDRAITNFPRDLREAKLHQKLPSILFNCQAKTSNRSSFAML